MDEKRFQELEENDKWKMYIQFLKKGNYDSFEMFCYMNRNSLVKNLEFVEITWR